jgi:hypothetical protein
MTGWIEMNNYIENPKTKGSGIICCIPQTGECPQKCNDCFFQSGRSYLEPLDENLPNIPTPEEARGRIVRMNDGNDSNVQRFLVEETAQKYDDYFFNTSIPKDLGGFSAPVVLTVNPAKMTDVSFHKLDQIPNNLMFVRVRVNTWNLDKVVEPVVSYYTACDVPVVLTYMAYYLEGLSKKDKRFYEWRKRTLNSYWVLKPDQQDIIESAFYENPLVYSCGYKKQFACKFDGNCIREYYNTKERIR